MRPHSRECPYSLDCSHFQIERQLGPVYTLKRVYRSLRRPRFVGTDMRIRCDAWVKPRSFAELYFFPWNYKVDVHQRRLSFSNRQLERIALTSADTYGNFACSLVTRIGSNLDCVSCPPGTTRTQGPCRWRGGAERHSATQYASYDCYPWAIWLKCNLA